MINLEKINKKYTQKRVALIIFLFKIKNKRKNEKVTFLNKLLLVAWCEFVYRYMYKSNAV